MPSSAPIGLFDSGIGGLTVAQALHRLLPGENLVYLGDTARVPYGNKTADTITRFSHENCTFLKTHGVKLIVVACNTASALALDNLRANVGVPLIGMITTGAEASIVKARKHVGIIGTAATIDSGAYPREIHRIKPELQVSSRSCPLLVPLVEEGWTDHPVTRDILKEYLQHFQSTGIDTLVLGCTHYPLLKKTISTVLGPNVALVDSAESSASAVASFLSVNDLAAPPSQSGQMRLFFTDLPRNTNDFVGRFLGRNDVPVEKTTL